MYVIKLRKIQTILTIAFILIALHICLTKNVSSSLFKCSSNLKLDYDAEITSQKIVPLSGEVTFSINVSYQVQGVLAERAVNYFSRKGITPTVDLRIKKTPKGCTAQISPNIVTPRLSTQWVSEEAFVHISFNEDASAHVPAIVVIEMHSHEISTFFYKINNVTKTVEMSFTPSYLAIIDVTPRNTYKEISPGEIVTFDIDLENLGNAETDFIFNVVEIPTGWNASIPSNIAIGSKVDGENPKKTVQLTIQPPNDPGYYNDREGIRITVYGRYFASTTEPQMRTASHQLIFSVRVRGTVNDTSIVDVEPIVLILSIVITALIIIIIIMALIIIKRF